MADWRRSGTTSYLPEEMSTGKLPGQQTSRTEIQPIDLGRRRKITMTQFASHASGGNTSPRKTNEKGFQELIKRGSINGTCPFTHRNSRNVHRTVSFQASATHACCQLRESQRATSMHSAVGYLI